LVKQKKLCEFRSENETFGFGKRNTDDMDERITRIKRNTEKTEKEEKE
jgi:hypothetical protein